MMTWTQMREVNRARRAGAPLGDIALMKFSMYGTADARQRERLRGLERPCFESDMEALRALPGGTVGREYARHLDRNGLLPLEISPAMKERYRDDPLALRLTTTHDLLHTITGFPTTPAGELGLFAFMVGQGFGPGRGQLRLAVAIYAVLLPLHLRGLLHNIRVGLRMAAEATSVLATPLDQLLDLPLDEARARLGIDPATVAAIDPGRPSWIIGRFLPKNPPRAEAAAA